MAASHTICSTVGFTVIALSLCQSAAQAACPSAGSTDRCGAAAQDRYGGSCKCIPGICCSQFGYCGPSAALNATDPEATYCGTGCQTAYGECGRRGGTPPPPPPPPPAKKTIKISVDSVRITNTRSRHEDTDTVSCYIKVNGQVTVSQNTAVGNKNNGQFSPGTVCNYTANPTDSVEVGFQIVNSGNSDTAKTAANLGINVLSSVLTAAGQVWAKFLPIATTQIFNVLFANCDGTVAADKAPASGPVPASSLQSVTYTNVYYPGYDSPAGCGSNSKYYVDWKVTVA